MRIEISKKQAEKIGFDKFQLFGLSESSWGWR
jgi:hypothetical protein